MVVPLSIACSGGGGDGTNGSATEESISEALTLIRPGVLAPPPAGSGYQVAIPAVTLAPGQEAFRCYHAQLQAIAPFVAGRFESAISNGTELSVYQVASDPSAPGTFDTSACTALPPSKWLFDSSASQETTDMPSGIGIQMGARQRLLVELHFINTTSARVTARSTVNVDKSTSPNPVVAGALVGFNTGIDIPPETASGPGSQTVSGNCTPAAGSQFFAMTIRTRRHGVGSTLSRQLASGQLGEEFVRTMDSAHPSSQRFTAPNFVQFNPGETLHYACSYANTTPSFITVGSSANSEICWSVSYYFPAVANGGTCN